MQRQRLSSSLPIKELEALLTQIAQLVNMSFILGIVLGVFLKMIIEAMLKGLAWLVKNRLQKVTLTVLLDYACEVASDGTITPMEPHLVIVNRKSDRLSISRIDVQYAERRLRKLLRGLLVETYRVLYDSSLIKKGIQLEPRGELKIFVRPATGAIFEIVETKPFLDLKDVRLTHMPAEAMRYVALSGNTIAGKSSWFSESSLRPTIR